MNPQRDEYVFSETLNIMKNHDLPIFEVKSSRSSTVLRTTGMNDRYALGPYNVLVTEVKHQNHQSVMPSDQIQTHISLKLSGFLGI